MGVESMRSDKTSESTGERPHSARKREFISSLSVKAHIHFAANKDNSRATEAQLTWIKMKSCILDSKRPQLREEEHVVWTHASFRQRQEDGSVGVKPNCACVSSVTSLNQTSGDGCWERIGVLNPGGTEYWRVVCSVCSMGFLGELWINVYSPQIEHWW